ncbi:hypothetical protein [Streptomyces sp. NPDC097610]|uniref:LexA family protein n=1 Tax=Streptomyces sp. NPDC097610 TaxID=3157227 RepID=UPI003325C267
MTTAPDQRPPSSRRPPATSLSLPKGLPSGRSAHGSAVSPPEPRTTTPQTPHRQLSTRQAQIIAFIEQSTDLRGYPPSLREIGDEVGLVSTSSVANQINNLENWGILKRDPHRPRSYQVVPVSERPHAGVLQRSACSLLVPDDSSQEASGTVFVLQIMLSHAVGNALLKGALLTVEHDTRPGPQASPQADHATVPGRVIAVTHPLLGLTSRMARSGPSATQPATAPPVPHPLNPHPLAPMRGNAEHEAEQQFAPWGTVTPEFWQGGQPEQRIEAADGPQARQEAALATPEQSAETAPGPQSRRTGPRPLGR